MSTNKNESAVSGADSNRAVPPMTVNMKKLGTGLGTVFAGVIQMLEALEPLTDMAAENTETVKNDMPDSITTEPKASEAEALPDNVPDKTTEQKPVQAAETMQTHGVTVVDLTKVIVRKVKQDRSNNEKIGAILKTYGAVRVSELPVEKYEAFLTDISQL